MATTRWDREREQLEQKLLAPEHQELLEYLQDRSPFMRQFRTWADVITCMRRGTSTDPQKDEVLRPIFQAHGEDQDQRWRTIFLAIFWPGLESIAHRNCHWDDDPNELWQNVVWTFLQVICRVDLERRPARLVQKVVNDTIHYVYQGYERRWKRTNREILTDPRQMAKLARAVSDMGLELLCLQETVELEIARLQEHLDAGRIKEADFFLLAGTRLYRQSVAEYARDVGLDYQVAKKRRQRAEAAIRRFEEETR